MRAEIRRIHRLLGSATIYVTHDQDEALSLADRIVVLRDGGVRQIGTPQQLFNRPAHLDVAEFMGFRNALPATIVRKQGDDVEMSLSGAFLRGKGMDQAAAGAVVAAIRPADLVPQPDGAIVATVTGMEYSGDYFLGSGRTAEGYEVFFRARDAIGQGEQVRLGAPADRILVYAREEGQ
ncbi:TOBE domain-containing protein [Acerihabitans sp.]|uniref:TOBE domain-containing protein n=1 Tax=Acerihabitans sp. TaxID=2811394 RepID=UPI002ED86056